MKALLILLAAIAFAIAPFLSPEFGGFEPNKHPVSQEFSSIFVTVWVFGMYGLISPALFLHSMIGFVSHKNDPGWEPVRYPLFASLGFGCLLVLYKLLSPILFMAVIWAMFGSAFVAFIKSREAHPEWIGRWPLAVYLGWIAAAAFASFYLVFLSYNLVSKINFISVALFLTVGFGSFYLLRFKSILLSICLVSGLMWIAFSHGGGEMPLIVLAFLGWALSLVILCFSKAKEIQSKGI